MYTNYWMNEQMNEWTNERTDERTDEWTNGRTNGRMDERKNERTKERKNERTKKRKNERTNDLCSIVHHNYSLRYIIYGCIIIYNIASTAQQYVPSFALYNRCSPWAHCRFARQLTSLLTCAQYQTACNWLFASAADGGRVARTPCRQVYNETHLSSFGRRRAPKQICRNGAKLSARFL